jgi:hypothetical protein
MIEYVREHAELPVVSARTELRVGVDARTFTIELGSWPPDGPDPGDALGLAGAPVVVVLYPALTTIVEAGARRAGRDARIECIPTGPDLGIRLLAARAAGAEVMVLSGGAEPLRLVRVLGGRPLAVPPLDRPSSLAAFLVGLDVDVHVAMPSGDERLRERGRSLIQPLELEARHHLVEVDPRPAMDELGLDAGAATLDELAAGAAGVLSGRVAAANARWRRHAGD